MENKVMYAMVRLEGNPETFDATLESIIPAGQEYGCGCSISSAKEISLNSEDEYGEPVIYFP